MATSKVFFSNRRAKVMVQVKPEDIAKTFSLFGYSFAIIKRQAYMTGSTQTNGKYCFVQVSTGKGAGDKILCDCPIECETKAKEYLYSHGYSAIRKANKQNVLQAKTKAKVESLI